MTDDLRLTDAERETLCVCPAVDQKIEDPRRYCDSYTAAVESILAERVRVAEAQAAEKALRDAADPMTIMRWAEGPCERGLSLAAVVAYLAERAAEFRQEAGQ